MPTLNWLGKKAVINHDRDVPFHLLQEVPELSFGDKDSGNLVIQGDNLIANVKKEESKMSELALAYELALQKAVEETRNAYSAYTQEYHRYQSLQGAVEAARAAVDISNDLYKNGLADFNNVLDAQRSLLTLEEALVISRGTISIDLIALYKALGGGVTPPPPEKSAGAAE